MLFPLGTVVATPAALAHLEANQVTAISLLQRHGNGDFGHLVPEDVRTNAHAIFHGLRVLSAYRVGDVKLYVITEADRSATTILLASEY